MLVRLYRDSFDTPWGFRLQGGRDLNQDLVIQRVFSNSPAEGELQRGDVILSINGRDARTLTHKQAQDSIKFGGGQVELLINRPPSGDSVKPLQPQSPTRAPPIQFPKKSSIQIPIRRSSDHGPRSMPPPAFAGHQPKKITLNKYGGGTSNFGTNFGAKAQQPGWSPQPSVYSQQYTPQPSMQDRVDSSPSHYQQQQYYTPPPQQTYQPPPQQTYQPPPPQQYYQPQTPQSPERAQYQPYSLNQPQKQTFQPVSPPIQTNYQSPGLSQPDYVRSEDTVEEEDYEYVPVSQRRNVFKDKDVRPPQMNSHEEEDYYPNCPVWERRRLFMRDQPKVTRTGKRRQYKSASETPQFGTDYSKGPTPAAVTVQQRPRAPQVIQRTVNAAPQIDEPDTSSFSQVWSGTLKSSGGPRPWEQENKEEYIMPSLREPDSQPARKPAPTVSPKPSRAKPQKAPQSPQRQITVRSVPNDVHPQDGAVHLQYNSPMGLYSNQNIQDTYNAQIGQAGINKTSSTVSPQTQQGQAFQVRNIGGKHDSLVGAALSDIQPLSREDDEKYIVFHLPPSTTTVPKIPSQTSQQKTTLDQTDSVNSSQVEIAKNHVYPRLDNQSQVNPPKNTESTLPPEPTLKSNTEQPKQTPKQTEQTVPSVEIKPTETKPEPAPAYKEEQPPSLDNQSQVNPPKTIEPTLPPEPTLNSETAQPKQTPKQTEQTVPSVEIKPTETKPEPTPAYKEEQPQEERKSEHSLAVEEEPPAKKEIIKEENDPEPIKQEEIIQKVDSTSSKNELTQVEVKSSESTIKETAKDETHQEVSTITEPTLKEIEQPESGLTSTPQTEETVSLPTEPTPVEMPNTQDRKISMETENITEPTSVEITTTNDSNVAIETEKIDEPTPVEVPTNQDNNVSLEIDKPPPVIDKSPEVSPAAENKVSEPVHDKIVNDVSSQADTVSVQATIDTSATNQESLDVSANETISLDLSSTQTSTEEQVDFVIQVSGESSEITLESSAEETNAENLETEFTLQLTTGNTATETVLSENQNENTEISNDSAENVTIQLGVEEVAEKNTEEEQVKKKERMDLSQFKKEKRKPAKIDLSQWQKRKK